MALGLLVSALVNRADKALTLLPLLLIPQLVLSFPQLRLDEKPVLAQLSYVASAQWGFASVASSIHLNGLVYDRAAAADAHVGPADPDQAPPDVVAAVEQVGGVEIQSRWRHVPAAWATDLAVQLGLFVVALLAAAWALARRDPRQAGRGGW